MSAVRGGMAVGLACGLVLVPTAALAEEPERTGWWNRLAAGGTALPQPTTAAGDLRISNAPDGPAAFAAVSYPSAGATDAVLTLALRAGRTVGTPDVLACPTTDGDWKEGGNQPYDAAPAYDCETAAAFGELAPDGTTLTFLLDSSTQDATGTWSLALVPTPGTTAPFTVDVAQPAADAFTSSGAAADAPPPPPPPPAEGDSGGAGSSGDAFLPEGFAALPPVDVGTAEVAPLVAGAAPVAAAAAVPEPAVAGAATPPATPFLLAQPAGVVEDLGSGRRLLALLVLAGGSAAVGYAAGQQRPGPRLIGGRSRVVPAAALVDRPPAEQDRPRGIGRFAKTRDAAPRRLR